MHNRVWCIFAAVLVAVSLTIGCGSDDGPTRFDVSGKVTFGGKPVPAGRIQFEPDVAKGNRGPAGFAVVHDGVYNTQQQGKGTIGGPHNVLIIGFDGVADPQHELPAGRRLFPNYRTTTDLPKQSSTMDFDVPAELP